jgi:hypothetical protein
MVAGRGARLSLWLGLLLTALLGAFPAGASALSSHPFLGSFCEPTGLGSAPCEPSFGVPAGTAVDEATGNVLVIDLEDHTLNRFKPNGEPAPFSALSSNVIDGHAGEEDEITSGPKEILSTESTAQVQFVQAAVAPPGSGNGTAGDIYVTDRLNERIDIFESSGRYIGQIVGAGSSCGVAVDPAGAVYVGDSSFGVHKFVPSAPAIFGPSSDFEFPGTCQVAAGAKPPASGGSEGFVFPVAASGPVAKLDSVTGELDYIVAPGENRNISVDPETGHLYIASNSAIFEYDVSGPSEAILLSGITPGGERVAGVAANGAGDVFITRVGNPQVEVWGAVELLPKVATEAADPVGGESATLNGTVNPEGLPLTECFFEWGETQAYGQIAPCKEPNAAEVGEGTSSVPVHAEISILVPGTNYHFRLVAANANGSEEGDDETLFTLGASIKDEAASLVTTNSARLSAQINPNGEEATFVFEYLTQAQFEENGEENPYAGATAVPEPEGKAGSGTTFKEVGVQLLGLEPDTTYVFRLVATTPTATHPGPDKTFTTRPISANLLPDGRAYELVTPPQKIGEIFPPESLGIWTGSCKNCLPGVTEEHMPMQAREDGEAVVYGGYPFTAGQASGPNEYLSERGPDGWGTQGLSPLLFASSEAQGYKAFSADLSRAVIYQIEPALTPDAPIGPEGKPYANLYLRSEGGTLTPLIAEAPPQRAADYENPDRFRIGFAAANAGTALVGALHHVAFEANDALTQASAVTPAAPTIGAEERNLYEWVDGELRLVNVAPGNGAALSGTVFGSGRLLGKGGEEGADFDGAVSDDGSRAFFSETATGQVYVRIEGKETREIQDHLGKFLVASGDGSEVLLSDGCLYEIETGGCEDLTEGNGGFQGILGATNGLSRIYFVDTEVLAPGAEEGKPNLYDWQEGATKYIATLLPNDNEFNGVVQPQVGDWMPSSASRTAQVSPDGRFLAFMSRAPLTGYDNHVRGKDECRPAEPAPCFEVFEYRADSEELICVSCNPSGERPLGTANLSLIGRGKNDEGKSGYPQPTNLTSNEGRIFFETQDNLTLGDSNGRIKDVYEWEPSGVGSCQRAKGCVYLISSGQGPNDSIFLDATPSGDDAFFITRDRLLAPDSDEKLDLYDARAPHVPGETVGFAEAKVAPCEGDACQGPISSAPPQQGFTSEAGGSGNVHPKHNRHHKKKHHKKHRHHHKHGGHR